MDTICRNYLSDFPGIIGLHVGRLLSKRPEWTSNMPCRGRHLVCCSMPYSIDGNAKRGCVRRTICIYVRLHTNLVPAAELSVSTTRLLVPGRLYDELTIGIGLVILQTVGIQTGKASDTASHATRHTEPPFLTPFDGYWAASSRIFFQAGRAETRFHRASKFGLDEIWSSIPR